MPRRHAVPPILLVIRSVIRFRESLDGGRFAVLFRDKVIQRIKILNFLLRLHGLQMGLALLLGEIEEAGHVQRHVRIRVQQIQLHRVEHNFTRWILVPVTISQAFLERFESERVVIPGDVDYRQDLAGFHERGRVFRDVAFVRIPVLHLERDRR